MYPTEADTTMIQRLPADGLAHLVVLRIQDLRAVDPHLDADPMHYTCNAGPCYRLLRH